MRLSQIHFIAWLLFIETIQPNGLCAFVSGTGANQREDDPVDEGNGDDSDDAFDEIPPGPIDPFTGNPPLPPTADPSIDLPPPPPPGEPSTGYPQPHSGDSVSALVPCDCQFFNNDYVSIHSPSLLEFKDDGSCIDAEVEWDLETTRCVYTTQCCLLQNDERPRCLKSLFDEEHCSRSEKPSRLQIGLAGGLLWRAISPVHFEHYRESYRHRFDLEMSAQLYHNPPKSNFVWGLDFNVLNAYALDSQSRVPGTGYQIFIRTATLDLANQESIMVGNRKENLRFIGRHKIGIHGKVGVLQQWLSYIPTFEDTPIYNFRIKMGRYETDRDYRNPQPMVPGLLARTGIEGRSHIGFSITNNNFFTLEIVNAHVLGVDWNSKVAFFGPALVSEQESMTTENPVVGQFTPELFERPLFQPLVETGGEVSIETNVGIATKPDTLRIHLGYSGEFTFIPGTITDPNGITMIRRQLNSVYFVVAMHLFLLQGQYINLSGEQEHDTPLSGVYRDTYQFATGKAAFHLFQVLAKLKQELDYYRHAINFYGEYLYRDRYTHKDEPPIVFFGLRSPHHQFHVGVNTIIPVFPSFSKTAKIHNGLRLDFIADGGKTLLAREGAFWIIAGLRVTPFSY